jgi:uncharacterized repeat protein (TIGR01451 family)
VIDQLAGEYVAASEPVVFLEQLVDSPLGDRMGRWWAAYGGGQAYLPLVMVSSGHQISSGYLGGAAHDTYKAMVDAELGRPAQAEIVAQSLRIGTKFHFDVRLTNLCGVDLSSSNSATIHAIVYEEHTPVGLEHVTGRIVRAAVSTSISPVLANGATRAFTLETSDLNNVADWSKVHTLVLADYRPGGTSGAYDMLQAVSTDARPALTVSKQATPDPVQPGAQLSYTLRVVNTGNMDLHATITDTLPAHVSPTGSLVWTPTITTPGGIWQYTFFVTVEAGYTGTLVNEMQVMTDEGVTGFGLAVTNGRKVYLPIVMRN